jgi:hypothetical protein
MFAAIGCSIIRGAMASTVINIGIQSPPGPHGPVTGATGTHGPKGDTGAAGSQGASCMHASTLDATSDGSSCMYPLKG